MISGFLCPIKLHRELAVWLLIPVCHRLPNGDMEERNHFKTRSQAIVTWSTSLSIINFLHVICQVILLFNFFNKCNYAHDFFCVCLIRKFPCNMQEESPCCTEMCVCTRHIFPFSSRIFSVCESSEGRRNLLSSVLLAMQPRLDP